MDTKLKIIKILFFMLIKAYNSFKTEKINHAIPTFHKIIIQYYTFFLTTFALIKILLLLQINWLSTLITKTR